MKQRRIKPNNPNLIGQPNSISVPSDSDTFLNHSSPQLSSNNPSNHPSNHKDFSFREKRKINGINDIVTFADLNSKANTIETMKSSSRKGDWATFKTREVPKKMKTVTRSEQINFINNDKLSKIHKTAETPNQIIQMKGITKVSSEIKNRVKANGAKMSRFYKKAPNQVISEYDQGPDPQANQAADIKPSVKTLYRNKRLNNKANKNKIYSKGSNNLNDLDKKHKLKPKVYLDSETRFKQSKTATKKKQKYSRDKLTSSTSPTTKNRKSRSLYTKNLKILNPTKKIFLIKKQTKGKDIHRKNNEVRARNMILKFKRELLKEQAKTSQSPHKISSSNQRLFFCCNRNSTELYQTNQKGNQSLRGQNNIQNAQVNHSQRKMDHPPSIYYTNKTSTKKSVHESIGRSNLSSSVQTRVSKKSASLKSKKYDNKKNNVGSQRKLNTVQKKKKLYHMKGRRMLPRANPPQSFSMQRKVPSKKRKKASPNQKHYIVKKPKSKLKISKNVKVRRGGAVEDKNYWIKAPKSNKNYNDKVTKIDSKRNTSKTNYLIEKYSNTQKISFSQPKTKNRVNVKYKVTTDDSANVNNIRNNRKLYKHSVKVGAKKRSTKKKPRTYQNKIALSVPKKNTTNANTIVKRSRRIVSSNKAIEKKSFTFQEPLSTKNFLGNNARNPLGIKRKSSRKKKKIYATVSQIKDNYKSENIYSPVQMNYLSGSSGLPIVKRKIVIRPKPVQRQIAPSISNEYINSIKQYNLSMEKFRTNLIQKGFRVHSEHYSISSHKSTTQPQNLKLYENYPNSLGKDSQIYRKLAHHKMPKSYSNVLYKKRNNSANVGRQKNHRWNYNSLYKDTTMRLNQKRSNSSKLDLNPLVKPGDAHTNNSFNPARYLALKEKIRGFSLNSTSKGLNLRSKNDSQKMKNKTSGSFKEQTHSSLPPITNFVIPASKSSRSPKAPLRVYKLEDNYLDKPESRRFIQGKKIYSLGDTKYISLNTPKQVSLKKLQQGNRFLTKDQKKRGYLNKKARERQVKGKKNFLPYTRNQNYIIEKRIEALQVNQERAKKKSINTEMLKELLMKLKIPEATHQTKEKEKSRKEIFDVIDMSFKLVEKNYKNNVNKLQRKMQKYCAEIKNLKKNLANLKKKKQILKSSQSINVLDEKPAEAKDSHDVITKLNKKLNQTNLGIQELQLKMKNMETQLQMKNDQIYQAEKLKACSPKKSSGINLKKYLIPSFEGNHKRSFTNQILHETNKSKQLEKLKKSLLLENQSDTINMKNYIRNMYDENVNFDSNNPPSSHEPNARNLSNTEDDYSHFYKRTPTKANLSNLLKMRKLLEKMGGKLRKRKASAITRRDNFSDTLYISQDKSEYNEYDKHELHEILTGLVNQLITEQENSNTNTTPEQSVESRKHDMRLSNTYKTFIELESGKFASKNSYVKRNTRGYHGFFHEDIFKSIVKLEGMMDSERKSSFGEVGIINRNGHLLNEKFSEMSVKENITSILGDSQSRVKGLTGEMGFNKQFNQKSVNDFDSHATYNLSEAQKKLEDLIEQQLNDSDSEAVKQQQKQKILKWERQIAHKSQDQAHGKISRTVNLNSIKHSLSKFTKKRTSQRYVLNSETKLSKTPQQDSLKELQKKVFTFESSHPQEKMISRKKKEAFFDFPKEGDVSSKHQSETSESVKSKDIQIPAFEQQESSFDKDSPKNSYQTKDSQKIAIDEAINLRKIESVQSEKSPSRKSSSIIKENGQAEDVQVKIYPESGSASIRGANANWSAVNNTTNISLRILDSRQNMSMIQNINFSRLVESNKNQKVPFNSKGASLNTSKRRLQVRDISNPNNRRSLVSDSAEKRSLFHPGGNVSSKHQSSRMRRINDLKDQKSKQNFMQKLLKNADIGKESTSRKNFLAGSNLNSIYNEIARSSSSNIKDLRSSKVHDDTKSEITLNTLSDPRKVVQSLKLQQGQVATDSINFSKYSKQVQTITCNGANPQKNSVVFNDPQNLLPKMSNKQFPIPPSLGKNSQSLTNNIKPYHSNMVYGLSKQTNNTEQYQTNPIYSDQKQVKPIEVLIEKDQSLKDEYQIDLNTPQFQELMGLKTGMLGSPNIDQEPAKSHYSSENSNPKILQYQNSGITFKDSYIPRGDSLMSQNSKISLNTVTNSLTDPQNANNFAFNPHNDFHMISAFAQQKSPSFQPDISGSGQSPEINLKQFLTPESMSRMQEGHFSKKRQNYDTLNSDEFFIENKEVEGKGSNFSNNIEESQMESEMDISLECTTENLNFGLHWSPGVEKRESQMQNLSGVSENFRKKYLAVDKRDESVISENKNNLGTGCQENFYTYSENRTITKKSDDESSEIHSKKLTPNPKSTHLKPNSNSSTNNKEFSLKSFTRTSLNIKSKGQIENSEIYKGPSFRCYEDQDFKDRIKEDQESEEDHRTIKSGSSSDNNELEIEISLEDIEVLGGDRSIGSDLFGNDEGTRQDDSSTSDINLSSLKLSYNDTPNELKTSEQINRDTGKFSKISNQFSGSKAERSSLQNESEDITLTVVSNSQQLSSQMNLRPSIQFMQPDTTEDFQMSDNGGSPFVNKMKVFMGESLKNPTDFVPDRQGTNHKFSHSEDLTNVFSQINKESKIEGIPVPQMETIRDIEDQMEEQKSPKFMNMEFFRTLGEEEDKASESDGVEMKKGGELFDAESESYEVSGEGLGNYLESDGGNVIRVVKTAKEDWESEDDFVDKSKFLNSQNLRSSRQMI